MHGISHLTSARSADGITDWIIDTQPTIKNDPSSSYEEWGYADPRIVYLEEQKQYAFTYTMLSKSGSRIALAVTKSFKVFARLGPLKGPNDDNSAFFPCRFNGRFAMIHRPMVLGKANIWISCSPDLKHWGDRRLLLETRPSMWDCHKIGIACPPIKTKRGWLIFYHGVENTADNTIYRIGLALLDLYEPWKVLRRSDDWILEASASYECSSDGGRIIFPTGVTVHENCINLYYGTANHCVAVASAKLDDVMKYIMSCPKVA
jgi:predicted GH43/DUF377 family glycosyl hydrolase